MSDDPRAFFRPAPHNCGTCAFWPANLVSDTSFNPKHESGALELPCDLHRGRFVSGASNYVNGWRRASDSCLQWTRRIT